MQMPRGSRQIRARADAVISRPRRIVDKQLNGAEQARHGQASSELLFGSSNRYLFPADTRLYHVCVEACKKFRFLLMFMKGGGEEPCPR